MSRVHGSLLAGLALLVAAGVFISRGTNPTSAPSRGMKSSEMKQVSGSPGQKSVRPPSSPDAFAARGLPELPPHMESPHPPGSVENQAWITKRITELDELAWFDDAGSLHRILAELRNPQPEIRAAALAATKAFGSSDAVPYLTIIAAETRDPAEQKNIADLIEYLNLPTLLDLSDPSAGGN